MLAPLPADRALADADGGARLSSHVSGSVRSPPRAIGSIRSSVALEFNRSDGCSRLPPGARAPVGTQRQPTRPGPVNVNRTMSCKYGRHSYFSSIMFLVALALVDLVGTVVADFVSPIELDYHNKFGVPAATRIKAAEEALGSSARILGGSPAGNGEYRYFGGVVISMTDGRTSVCGSTLLSHDRAVTAAHCWRSINGSARQFELVFGSNLLFHGGTRVTTTDVEMHEDFNMNTLANDVAIIRMRWIIYSGTIHNIELASGTDQFVGTWAWTAGFGTTSDSTGISPRQFLSHVQLQVISNAECQQTYGSTFVQASTLCVATSADRGTCVGDSGGPLVANDLLIGISSFGPHDSCQRNHPDGFARVTSFVSWIRNRL